MTSLPVRTWIGNAAAVLCGRWGAVTHQAAQAGCSRQAAYTQAGKVEAAVVAARAGGPDPEALRAEIEALRAENRQLWDCLEHAVDLPPATQQRFAITAAAFGLSVRQTRALLALLLPGRRCPSRATLGRWVQQAGRQAGRVLQVLDRACHALVLVLCLDEIFFRRRPVLMAVEPHSLAWLVGTRAADRSGPTWAGVLAPWERVEDVAADGGSGIELGLHLATVRRQERAARTQTAAVPLRKRPDVFHIQRAGTQALRAEWAAVQRLWEVAETLDRDKARLDRRGQDKRRCNGRSSARPWAKATAAFAAAEQKEQAWQRAVAALALFRPDGALNDRAWAEAELAAATAVLTGPRWGAVRRAMRDPRTLTFLDRMHAELAEAEPCPQRRALLVALGRGRRTVPRGRALTPRAAQARLRGLVAVLAEQRLDAAAREAYPRVRRVLSRVLRASSAVECVNSAARMHQARHRKLTQGLLDLKRLFWNCKSFEAGRRRRRCPYQHLGLRLPTYDAWELLQIDPTKLEQQVSTPTLAT